MMMMMPPAIATLSLRSRLHAIWPSDRPSMALSDADNASSGAGPPGPVATSMGTAIVKPTCNSDYGTRAHGSSSSLTRGLPGRHSLYLVRLLHFPRGYQTRAALVA